MGTRTQTLAPDRFLIFLKKLYKSKWTTRLEQTIKTNCIKL